MLGRENIIKKKSILFALDVIAFGEKFSCKHQFVIANQLIRSGTAIGALVHESQFAESKLDFIHKLKIALKEANETLYWLSLCEQSEQLPKDSSLKLQAEKIIKILVAIVNSTRKGNKELRINN